MIKKKDLTKLLISSIIFISITGCQTFEQLKTRMAKSDEEREPTSSLQRHIDRNRGKIEYCVTRPYGTDCSYLTQDEIQWRLRNMGLY